MTMKMVANMQLLVCIGMFSCLVLLSSVNAHPLSKGYLDEMPEGCEGQDYCFRNETYPARLIEDLLSQLEISFDNVRQPFIHRDGVNDGYQTPCDTVISFDRIYEIVDEAGRVRFVVQSEQKFLQIYKLEICTHPNEPLTHPKWKFDSKMVRNFKIACEQKNSLYYFKVLNLAADGFEWVRIRSGLPDACICRVQERM